MTRVVVISDTHGCHRDVEVPDGDILVHAGDFTGSGRMSDVDEVDDWLVGLPHSTKLVVAGNCDRCCERNPDEVRDRLTDAHYLQDDALEIDGIQFWGSPWQPKFLNMAFNLPRGEASPTSGSGSPRRPTFWSLTGRPTESWTGPRGARRSGTESCWRG